MLVKGATGLHKVSLKLYIKHHLGVRVIILPLSSVAKRSIAKQQQSHSVLNELYQKLTTAYVVMHKLIAYQVLDLNIRWSFLSIPKPLEFVNG